MNINNIVYKSKNTFLPGIYSAQATSFTNESINITKNTKMFTYLGTKIKVEYNTKCH